MRFDLTDLKLFLYVHEAGTMTKAAARAHMTLASASERIRGMEELLGVPLLTRDRRGVVPTPAGNTLIHHARLVLNQVDLMHGDLNDYGRGLKGHVRLLCNTSAISEYLPNILGTFLLDNPLVSIDLEERTSLEIADAIRTGMCDMGVAARSSAFDGIMTYPFCEDTLVCILPRNHPLSKRTSLSLSDVAVFSFVGLPQGSALQTHITHHARQAGKTLTYRIRVNSFEAICRLVGQAVGVGIVPATAARRYGRSMHIKAVALDDAWATRELVVCVRDAERLAAHANNLMQYMLSQAPAQCIQP